MSEKLMLPREWTQKSIGPVWKAAALAGWAIAILLAQCLVMLLAWPGLRPAPPPPAELPAPRIAPKTHGDLEVAHSMARIRCLVAVGRTQEALAETIRCLTLCERLEIDPPAELPGLFAATVTSISAQPASSVSSPTNQRQAGARPAPRPPISTPPACQNGRVPGPGYPQAPPRPRLAQLPPVGQDYALMPPPPPLQNQSGPGLPPPPPSGRYEFQPPPGAPPPGY